MMQLPARVYWCSQHVQYLNSIPVPCVSLVCDIHVYCFVFAKQDASLSRVHGAVCLARSQQIGRFRGCSCLDITILWQDSAIVVD